MPVPWRRCNDKDVVVIEDSSLTFDEAAAACEALGGSLFQPGKASEAEIVANSASVLGTGKVFVGARYISSAGELLTLDGVSLTSLDEIVWGSNQPPGAMDSDDCVSMTPAGTLRVIPCSNTKPFACETVANQGLELANECAPEPTGWFRCGEREFRLETDKTDYAGAQAACDALGGELMRPGIEVETNYAEYLLDTAGFSMAWVGADDIDQDGVVLTLDGVDLSTLFAEFGGKVNAGDDCVATNQNSKNRMVPCDRLLSYVCAKATTVNTWDDCVGGVAPKASVSSAASMSAGTVGAVIGLVVICVVIVAGVFVVRRARNAGRLAAVDSESSRPGTASTVGEISTEGLFNPNFAAPAMLASAMYADHGDDAANWAPEYHMADGEGGYLQTSVEDEDMDDGMEVVEADE